MVFWNKARILVWVLLLCSLQGWAQSDSSLQLRPERLGIKDLLTRKTSGRQRVVVTATRTAEPIQDLPYYVWIITADDILLNGYVTLVDVLRAAPGIRVSQPGNAAEGETFMMRGLPGNSFVKILINDIPIKPTVVNGLPVAAQLPIRQAERIEVYYGPAAALYGNEACAGVVNIILKETERPIFTQADLGFGTQGYNSLDLMLGGKLGKDKRILRFSLYGSSTVRSETDIFYDQSLYNTNRYLPFGLDKSVYLQSPGNYRTAGFGSVDSIPKIIPIPQESRMFGANFTLKGLHFNYNRMSRSDFSGLGTSPLAQSWSNPSSVLTDRLETYALGFKINRRRYGITNNFSVLRYQVDKNATASYIFDGLSTALYATQISNITSPDDRQQVLKTIYNNYNSQERYYTANGLDGRLESILHTAVSESFSADVGAQFNLGTGAPLLGHFRFPVELDLRGNGIAGTPHRPMIFTSQWQAPSGMSMHLFNLIGSTNIFEYSEATASTLPIRKTQNCCQG
ncbi:MAG: TonB-dependent receptor plug domain-containing protein [Lewinellaceae bacterium]|nr:TonB-dependent receptor plug domain-containing protein [Lewinellaceae bacterium]